MNLGSILGSLSPGFGMLSGQGLGKFLPFLSPAFGLSKLLGGHGGGGGGQEQPDPSGGMAGPGGLAGPMGAPGLDISQFAQQMGGRQPQPMGNPFPSGSMGAGSMGAQKLMQMLMQQGGGNFLGRLGGGY